MVPSVTFQTASHNSELYQHAVVLRNRILREPLGLKLDPVALANETGDIHLVGLLDGKVVASVTLTPIDAAVLRARQVAIDDSLQGKGVGTQLMRAAESLALSNGFRRMTLHARESAIPFYVKLGYEKEGRRFQEIGIAHQIMSRELWVPAPTTAVAV